MKIRKQQRGIAAIEFALVFPLLFLIFYGTFVYGYVFFLQQSISFAAQEAVLAAVHVPPTDPGEGSSYTTRLEQAVRTAAMDSLEFLPSSARDAVLGDQGASVQVSIQPTALGGTVQVTLQMDPSKLLPVITLPGIGAVPPLPQRLRAVGTVGV